MSATINEIRDVVLDYPRRHAVSVEEYSRMGELGVFEPEARLELIEGELVEMAPIGSPHAGTVRILTRQFTRLAGDLAIVSVQNPVIIGDLSVPQPDLALLRPRADSYTRSHPTAAEVLLVVEVSDSTLRFDLGAKIPLYARFGIAEAWVVDLQDSAVRVFRDPSANGYRESHTALSGTSVCVLALPAIVIALSELFPG